MSQYTPEQVDCRANVLAALPNIGMADQETVAMLRAYAATLRQSADSGRVGDAFAPIPEAVDAPNAELWAAYQAFNAVYMGMNTQQALRAAINGVLANRAALAAQGQGEHVGWVDEFGNTYPIGAHSLTGKLSWLDAHKRNWRPLYTRPAPAASPAGVPDGYVLVPREPTDEMVEAGRSAVMARDCSSPNWGPADHYRAAGISREGIPDSLFEGKGKMDKAWGAELVYAAMLAAAPSAPEGDGGEG